MVVVGAAGDDVNEYSLSTGFAITKIYILYIYNVAGKETVPTGLAFNTNGTKMFVVGNEGDDVNEYTLSTGFGLDLPDPTTDKDVIGLIDAQVQGVKRLAEQTTNSILDRITHVRSQDLVDETSQQDINVSFTNPDLTLASSLVTMPKMPNLSPFQGFQTEEWSTWTKADITIGKIGDTSLSRSGIISVGKNCHDENRLLAESCAQNLFCKAEIAVKWGNIETPFAGPETTILIGPHFPVMFGIGEIKCLRTAQKFHIKLVFAQRQPAAVGFCDGDVSPVAPKTLPLFFATTGGFIGLFNA